MDIFLSMTLYNRILLAVGIVEIVMGVLQLKQNKCIGISTIEQYTAESVRQYRDKSSRIYMVGGILLIIITLAIQYIDLKLGLRLALFIPSLVISVNCLMLMVLIQKALKKKPEVLAKEKELEKERQIAREKAKK